jgi:hypothetical protein
LHGSENCSSLSGRSRSPGAVRTTDPPTHAGPVEA